MTFKIKKPMRVFVIISLTLVAFMVISFVAANNIQSNFDDFVRSKLESNNFQVITASIHSPAIEVTVDSTQNLIYTAQRLNVTVIYDTNQGFVVLDTTTNVGYIFDPQILSWLIVLGVFGALSGIAILAAIIFKYGDMEN